MTTPKDEPLMPMGCPFCGEVPDVWLHPDYNDWRIECENMGCIQASLIAPDEIRAIALWNRRALPLTEQERYTLGQLIEILEERDYVPEAEQGMGLEGARRFHPSFAALVRRLTSPDKEKP